MRGSVHVSEEELAGWFAGRLPDTWFSGPPEVSTDREEILVVGTLSEPELAKDAAPETVVAARAARIDGGSPTRPRAGSADGSRGAPDAAT